MGKFQPNSRITTGTSNFPDPRGTARWVAFSRDPQQKYMFAVNGSNEAVHNLSTGQFILSLALADPGTNSAISFTATPWRSTRRATFMSPDQLGPASPEI
jgi:hypothetical protein